MSSVAGVPGVTGPPDLKMTRRVIPLGRRSRTSHEDTGTNGWGASALISWPRQSWACESTGDAPGALTGAVKAAETSIAGRGWEDDVEGQEEDAGCISDLMSTFYTLAQPAILGVAARRVPAQRARSLTDQRFVTLTAL
jgi:hypothetical protein